VSARWSGVMILVVVVVVEKRGQKGLELAELIHFQAISGFKRAVFKLQEGCNQASRGLYWIQDY